MIEWKRICCAVDFAEPSRIAMQRAAELAKHFEAELTIVHVLAPLPEASELLVSSRGVLSAEAQEAEEALARWRSEAERRAGRPVGSRILRGDPAAEIVRDAREQRCDLLVVGTHGRTGVRHLVLGSVAERVAREVHCPVLVVHDAETAERKEIADEAAQYR